MCNIATIAMKVNQKIIRRGVFIEPTVNGFFIVSIQENIGYREPAQVFFWGRPLALGVFMGKVDKEVFKELPFEFAVVNLIDLPYEVVIVR